jgi:dethiobiotin synthetase
MLGPLLYITGTNTGVGKTLLAALLLRRQAARRIRTGAMKPFCSGGREDAERLHALQFAGLTLDQVNPFHFAEPITPLLAARLAQRKITLAETIAALDAIREPATPLVIEGAGGLLSPLGEGFTLHDLIQARPGRACIVAGNMIGVINLVCLTSRQLNLPAQDQSIVLMDSQTPDASSASNALLLAELIPGAAIHSVPYLHSEESALSDPKVVETLDRIWA